MSNEAINKKFKVNAVLDKSLQDPGNDPAIQQKAEKATAFLKKQGAPKSLSTCILGKH